MLDPVDPATVGVTDHGALTGLGDDDHAQYALASNSSAAGAITYFLNSDTRTLRASAATINGSGAAQFTGNVTCDAALSVTGVGAFSAGVSGVSTIPAWHVNDGTLTGVTIANYTGASGFGTAALAANRLYFMPLLIPSRKPAIDQIMFEVTATAAGSASARIGIYSATSQTNWMPSGAPLDDSGDIAIGVTGGSTGVKTFSVTRSLNPGIMHWLAIGSDSTPTIRTIGTNGYYAMPADPTNLSTRRYGLQIASWTYGTLPTDPAAVWLTSATVVPLLAVRCSS